MVTVLLLVPKNHTILAVFCIAAFQSWFSLKSAYEAQQSGACEHVLGGKYGLCGHSLAHCCQCQLNFPGAAALCPFRHNFLSPSFFKCLFWAGGRGGHKDILSKKCTHNLENVFSNTSSVLVGKFSQVRVYALKTGFWGGGGRKNPPWGSTLSSKSFNYAFLFLTLRPAQR